MKRLVVLLILVCLFFPCKGSAQFRRDWQNPESPYGESARLRQQAEELIGVDRSLRDLQVLLDKVSSNQSSCEMIDNATFVQRIEDDFTTVSQYPMCDQATVPLKSAYFKVKQARQVFQSADNSGPHDANDPAIKEGNKKLESARQDLEIARRLVELAIQVITQIINSLLSGQFVRFERRTPQPVKWDPTEEERKKKEEEKKKPPPPRPRLKDLLLLEFLRILSEVEQEVEIKRPVDRHCDAPHFKATTSWTLDLVKPAPLPPHNQWRDVFYNQYPSLKPFEQEIEIHHAIERNILQRPMYKGLFTEHEILVDIRNLRGVCGDQHQRNLHRSRVRRAWNRFELYLAEHRMAPTRHLVMKFARAIDDKWGHLFYPYQNKALEPPIP